MKLTEIPCRNCGGPIHVRADWRDHPSRPVRELCMPCFQAAKIIYECRCVKPVKFPFQYDATRPNEVFFLCATCFRHARANELYPYAVDSLKRLEIDCRNSIEGIRKELYDNAEQEARKGNGQ